LNPLHAALGIDPAYDNLVKLRTDLWATGFILTTLTIFIARAETSYTILKSFGFLDQAGYAPSALISGNDGNFYGSALLGGSIEQSASPDNPRRAIIFRMSATGSNYLVLHEFPTNVQTVSALTMGTNGVLFGTTDSGGVSNRGIMFSLSTDGTGYAALHEFGGSAAADGDRPVGLIHGNDAVLYGTTTYGGTSSNLGTVFRLNTDGNDYSVLRRFSGTSGDGKQPLAGVIEGSDGYLYGTTHLGGTSGKGTVFKLAKDGSQYSIVTHFFGTNGALPKAKLIEGSDGLLYGTTEVGGRFNLGTIFMFAKTGNSNNVLHDFTGGGLGSGPVSPLVEGADGALYGTTPYNAGCDTIFKITEAGTDHQVLRSCVRAWQIWSDAGSVLYAHAGREIVRLGSSGNDYEPVRRFTVGGGDGEVPCTLMESSEGVLYGASENGGQWDTGAIFKLNKDGSGYALLHHFTNQDFAVPSRLLEGSDGLLYGITRRGAIFRMNKDGSSYTNVFSGFAGTGLIEASDGLFYGTTLHGGTAGRGTVFKVDKNGTGHTVLHSFTGNGIDKDGAYPEGGVIEGSDGWLYGASEWGGSRDGGMIYKLRKDGSGYTELYAFPHTRYEAGPNECVVEGSDGALYGATLRGGDFDSGFVFRLHKDGTGFVQLLSFSPRGYLDGQHVIIGSDGVLYGTTFGGGVLNQGMLFRLNTDGKRHIVLHHFVNQGGDGGAPSDVMIEGSDGALYGVTRWGGQLSLGTVFRLVPPPEISGERRSNGLARVIARSLSGRSVAIEASTNLSQWAEIASGSATNGAFSTQDIAPMKYRFYRARRN
jgi:uncharacterized repeat protein (TIGR03803 family)